MDNKTLSIFVGTIFGCIIILFGMKLLNMYEPSSKETYIAKNTVATITIERQGEVYTANKAQTESMLDILNQALPIGKAAQQTPQQLGIDRIVIDRVKGADITLTPIAWTEDMLVFSAPEWNPNSDLREYSNGRFKALIEEITKK